MLKKLIKCICILAFIIILNYYKIERISYNIKINNIIKNSKRNPDYIEIDNYKLLIKSGSEKEILDSNYVYLMNVSTDSNIFLAGHNSHLVFNRIYNLKVKDQINLMYKNKKRIYYVEKYKYIDVDDYDIFNLKNNLILITCSNNNQKRYVVICKLYNSHNFP